MRHVLAAAPNPVVILRQRSRTHERATPNEGSMHSSQSPVGNVREIDSSSIPDHDILVGGFPCQPFSISGVSKKNSLGRKHGFADKTQGTLFFEVARIINDKRPSAFVLENVKHLVRHDRGRTMETILETLSGDLGYHVVQTIVS